MKRKQYKADLKAAIIKYGYWSKEVNELNNKALKHFSLVVYTSLQNSVRSALVKK